MIDHLGPRLVAVGRCRGNAHRRGNGAGRSRTAAAGQHNVAGHVHLSIRRQTRPRGAATSDSVPATDQRRRCRLRYVAAHRFRARLPWRPHHVRGRHPGGREHPLGDVGLAERVCLDGRGAEGSHAGRERQHGHVERLTNVDRGVVYEAAIDRLRVRHVHVRWHVVR